MIGYFNFLAGFVAGWVVTTEEGKRTVNGLMAKGAELVKDNLSKLKSTENN